MAVGYIVKKDNRLYLKKKINLYFDCDGVILDTIATARRLAKEKGYNPNDFDELHEFLFKNLVNLITR